MSRCKRALDSFFEGLTSNTDKEGKLTLFCDSQPVILSVIISNMLPKATIFADKPRLKISQSFALQLDITAIEGKAELGAEKPRGEFLLVLSLA